MGSPRTLTMSLYCSRDSVKLELTEAVSWLQQMLDEVPAEFRDNAWFEVSLDHGYDSTDLDFQVYYNRLETEAEVAEREAKDAAYKEQSRRDEEKRLLYRLEQLRSTSR